MLSSKISRYYSKKCLKKQVYLFWWDHNENEDENEKYIT